MIAIPITYIMIGLGISFLSNAKDDWKAHMALAVIWLPFIGVSFLAIVVSEAWKLCDRLLEALKR